MQWWHLAESKFSQLSIREKWLLLLCGIVAVGMLLFTLVVEPAVKANRILEQQRQSTRLTNQKLEADILLATAKLGRDPDQEINQQYKQLLKQSQQMSQELANMVATLLTPSQMAELLEQVLHANPGLLLESLESLEAEPITHGNSNHTGYYLHPVRLVVTGDYFAILNYLQKLESMPVKYYWRKFDYQVESYPKARLVLEVYTLGTSQEFIGG